MNKFLSKNIPATNSVGFTLIELLVVITIIAILAVVGLTVYGGVQKNARDAKRRVDVQAIQKALEAHYNDSSCLATAAAPYCAVTVANAPKLFANGSVPAYPSNPDGTASYVGLPAIATNTYTICGKLETSNGNYNDAGITPNANNTGAYYCLNNQQ